MNPVDDYRKYCGSKLVYDASGQRRPVFLQRNLRKVLDHHEHNLNLLKHPSTNSTSDSTTADMLPNTENSRFLPSLNMLFNAIKPAQQTLNIQPKHLLKIRKPDGDPKGILGVAKPEPSVNPTWLPAPNQIQIKCNVHCSVVVHDESDKPTRVLYTESRVAKLTETNDDKGDPAFAIDMKPFVITENQLLTTQLANHNTNGGRRWKTDRRAQVALMVGINCFNSEDASELLSVIDPDTSSRPTLSPKQAELRVFWRDLSDSTLRNQTLLRRYEHEPEDQFKRSPSKTVDYSLRAGISWTGATNSRGSPLSMCNHIMRLVQRRIQPKAPETVHRPQICHITYLFDGGPIGSRTIIRTDLGCVFCPGRLPHPTFDRLHFHYLSFHDHFTFKVHKPAATDSGSVTRTVRIELAAPKYERASDNVCDEREITWIKPDIPFDLQQYLSEGGYNNWASGKQLALKAFPKTAKPGCMSKGIARPKASFVNGHSRLTPSNCQLKVRPPEEVPEVPSRKRKRFEVPEIPGVTIFRAEIEGFPQLTGAAREFAILFDEHLQDEPRNLANVHVCEAVVRFVRRFAARLRQPHLLQELKSKLDELMDMDLISNEYVEYCLALVAEKGETTSNGTGQGHIKSGPVVKEETAHGANQAPSSTAPQSHNRLDVIMIDDSDTEPGAEVSLAVVHQTNSNDVHMQDATHHAPNACVCGKVPSGSRKVITCRNIFHMACVGLNERLPDWRCEDCRPATD
ncbi:unnamed protein product [Aureobasidium mustum]|uniref:Zinc finger PHD-type domain-containing protein n=1 Tax=Aureobasidium mustum TaxID=2773714 RepID=A0A9N8PEL5_9PEZI|nr:unnamed protein product [Aureobasidium mustum]